MSENDSILKAIKALWNEELQEHQVTDQVKELTAQALVQVWKDDPNTPSVGRNGRANVEWLESAEVQEYLSMSYLGGLEYESVGGMHRGDFDSLVS